MQKNSIEIIHICPDYFVINKPAGVSVTADRSGDEELLTRLKKQLHDEGQFRLVHRLDKFTSGVMLIARNRQAQSLLSSHFEKRLIKKTYLALVSGAVRTATRTISSPIARSKKNPRLMRVDGKRGKAAETNYKLLADFGLLSLLAVRPRTGRTHQIRLHLAHIHLPLAIDPLYGSAEPLMLSHFKEGYVLKRGKTERPLIERLTLHAYQIELPPTAFGPAIYTAGLDRKFAATIKMLTKHNPNGQEAFLEPDSLAKILASQTI